MFGTSVLLLFTLIYFILFENTLKFLFIFFSPINISRRSRVRSQYFELPLLSQFLNYIHILYIKCSGVYTDCQGGNIIRLVLILVELCPWTTFLTFVSHSNLNILKLPLKLICISVADWQSALLSGLALHYVITPHDCEYLATA